MKQLNLIRNLFSVAVMITLACNVSAQVSIRDRIQIMDRDIFNYPESTEAPFKTKKSKTNRIVYSDRTGNQSYEDPYFQRKRSSHGIGTPYYIVGEKNGTYKLVQADPDITGKPKSIIGFLYNSKRHFKEPRKVNYAGWIPSENVLMYDHARINPRNNQPIRYRIGINSINKLFDIHQFFNGDTLKIYGEPFLKTTTDAVVVSGEVVYLYKLDKSGKSALISNVPALSDSTKRFLGWVPADLLAEVGQNEVYHIDYSRYRDSLLCAVNLMYPDTLALHNANNKGRPVTNVIGGRITITVESTRETTILEAMVNSPFKAISGKVIYYNTKDNSIFRVVEFKYAYIVYYKEVYNVDRKRQMYSTITFSADIIMIGDAYLSNQW